MTERDRGDTERGRPRVREYVGYTELQPGQNFYDQPPFDSIISGINEKYYIEPLRLNAALSHLALSVRGQIQATTDTGSLVSPYVQNPYRVKRFFPKRQFSDIECLAFQ